MEITEFFSHQKKNRENIIQIQCNLLPLKCSDSSSTEVLRKHMVIVNLGNFHTLALSLLLTLLSENGFFCYYYPIISRNLYGRAKPSEMDNAIGYFYCIIWYWYHNFCFFGAKWQSKPKIRNNVELWNLTPSNIDKMTLHCRGM